MLRRRLLQLALCAPFVDQVARTTAIGATARRRQRVRPQDPAWPTVSEWERLGRDVGGRLSKPVSPFAGCSDADPECAEALNHLHNPYYLGDQAPLTQASGWLDAWTCQPSAYAVAATGTKDVTAAVDFARTHNLRLAVKGGGHGYQGVSNAPDSLLIWLRAMNRVTLHDRFVARRCELKQSPQPAVTLGAGALWADAYEAVTTRAGRYVQGGGCRTVGVAGLVLGGGFGSWSKRFGTAASNLLEAEIVTANGIALAVNECLHSDLFWALKGGGGGTFGVVTSLTLKTHQLPAEFGVVSANIMAETDDAYRALIARAMALYHTRLLNEHWGEKFSFGPSNTLEILMVYQGLTRQQVDDIWAPFFSWIEATREYSYRGDRLTLTIPAQRFWDPDYVNGILPGAVMRDGRPGAPPHHAYWTQNQNEAGQFLHGYQSAWLPASLLEPSRQSRLVDAIFSSSRHWDLEFHFGKGLAGAPAEQRSLARQTATNPAVVEAFALAIIGDSGPPAYPGMPAAGSSSDRARAAVIRIGKAMNELLKVAPGAGSYVSESDYFQKNWQAAFWGENYPRLLAIKRKYDPAGLFFVRHGVGSEAWSDDGFTPA